MAIGETVVLKELVKISLNGFTKDWEVFVKGTLERQYFPDWGRLWSGFTQEELWESYVDESSSGIKKVKEEESVTLTSRKSKGKSKKSYGTSSKGDQKKKEKDLSKIKYFKCHQLGHFSSQCPLKKKKKAIVASEDVDDMNSKFRAEFALMSRLSSSSSTDVFFIDNGVSCHMTWTKEHLSSYKEEKMTSRSRWETRPSVLQLG